jgi:hypothetical protein
MKYVEVFGPTRDACLAIAKFRLGLPDDEKILKEVPKYVLPSSERTIHLVRFAEDKSAILRIGQVGESQCLTVKHVTMSQSTQTLQ